MSTSHPAPPRRSGREDPRPQRRDPALGYRRARRPLRLRHRRHLRGLLHRPGSLSDGMKRSSSPPCCGGDRRFDRRRSVVDRIGRKAPPRRGVHPRGAAVGRRAQHRGPHRRTRAARLIGGSSLVVPAPDRRDRTELRGRPVSPMITIGIFASYIVGYAFSSSGWRWIPAAVPSLLMPRACSRSGSPRWLPARGRIEDARKALRGRTRRKTPMRRWTALHGHVDEPLLLPRPLTRSCGSRCAWLAVAATNQLVGVALPSTTRPPSSSRRAWEIPRRSGPRSASAPST